MVNSLDDFEAITRCSQTTIYEFVPGQTLEDRMADGSIDRDQAIARQPRYLAVSDSRCGTRI